MRINAKSRLLDCGINKIIKRESRVRTKIVCRVQIQDLIVDVIFSKKNVRVTAMQVEESPNKGKFQCYYETTH